MWTQLGGSAVAFATSSLFGLDATHLKRITHEWFILVVHGAARKVTIGAFFWAARNRTFFIELAMRLILGHVSSVARLLGISEIQLSGITDDDSREFVMLRE